jgi:hypothetical protein
MSVIDKNKLESRWAVGCSNPDYNLHRTTCCSNFCVEDDELLQLYFDPADSTKWIWLEEACTCPFCGSNGWKLAEVENVDDVPVSWNWASTAK